MWIKSCIYIIGGLCVILGDADISFKLGFWFVIILDTLDNLVWEKNRKCDLKWAKIIQKHTNKKLYTEQRRSELYTYGNLHS